jgi:hypothetical protein
LIPWADAYPTAEEEKTIFTHMGGTEEVMAMEEVDAMEEIMGVMEVVGMGVEVGGVEVEDVEVEDVEVVGVENFELFFNTKEKPLIPNDLFVLL